MTPNSRRLVAALSAVAALAAIAPTIAAGEDWLQPSALLPGAKQCSVSQVPDDCDTESAPSLVVAPDGTTTIAWQWRNASTSGNRWEVKASTRAPGAATFGAAQTVNDTTGAPLGDGNANKPFPSTGVAADGTTTVMWKGGAWSVGWAARAGDAATFAPQQTLGVATGPLQGPPSLAVAANGMAVGAWQETAGASCNIVATVRYTADDVFSAATPIASGLSGNCGRPQAAAAPDGTLTVIWSDQGLVQGRTLPSGSYVWDPATTFTGLGETPDIAVGADSTTAVAWKSTDAGVNNRIEAMVRPAGGSFGAVMPLTGTGGSDPQVVVAPDGAVTAAWADSTSAPPVRMMARTLAAGQGQFGGPETAASVTSFSNTGTKNLDAAVSADGSVTIAWEAATGNGDPYVQAVTRPAGGAFGSIATLQNPTANDLSSPTFTVAGGPGAMFAGAWDADLKSAIGTTWTAPSTPAPASAPGTPTAGAGTTPVSTSGFGVRIPTALATAGLPVSKRGTVTLPLECPSDVPGGTCDASGVLLPTTATSLDRRLGRRDHASRTRVLARFRGVKIAAGRRASHTVRLDPGMYAQLHRASARRVPVTLRTVNRLADGTPVVTSQRVWLRTRARVVPVTG